MEMKLYELTAECEAWGIAVSGKKADLQNRLNSFFRGEPVLRKGCSKQFLQLKTEIEESGASSSQMPLMPKAKPKAKMTAKKSAAKPASKPLTGHKAQAYSYASEQEEEDLPKINDEKCFFHDPVDFGFDPTPYFESADGSPSIGGTFRGSPSPKATSPRTSSKARLDPRTGILVPAEMSVGQIVPWLRCPVGDRPMVRRRSRDDAGLFFRCRDYPRCGGTRKFADVVAVAVMGSQSSTAGASGHRELCSGAEVSRIQ